MKRDLGKLSSKVFDVLIIGGGIHAAITAWDAALRGLSVALIDRGDFGGATSQNSLKIIHGGLRYLQDGNLSRIRTMARERTTWMKIAPHLVHPLTCLMPTQRKIWRGKPALSVVLTVNDLLSFDRNRLPDPEKYLPRGRIISRQDLCRMLPGYSDNRSTGAAIWQDAQIYNSERLLLDFILSAADAGAEVANYVEAVGFLSQSDRIVGVRAKDVESGLVFEIRSRIVVNCAGAWVDGLLHKIPLQSGFGTSIAMNLIVDQLWPDIAVGLPSRPADGKQSQTLFIVSWRNKSMIGTWHIPWNRDPDAFQMKEAFIQGFLDEINSTPIPVQLSLRDVHHVTWGFLPVNHMNAGIKDVKLTRDGVVIDHQTKDGVCGLISVIGVKYSSARAVAEQAVDLAVKKLAVKAPGCQTEVIPVSGGWIDDFGAFLAKALAEAPRGVDRENVEHLVYTYGSNYKHLVPHMIEQPRLKERIDPALPVTAGEVFHAIRHEMALTLEDVIRRRTELGAAGLPPAAALQKCAELIGRELGWSMEREQQEIDSASQAYFFKPVEMLRA